MKTIKQVTAEIEQLTKEGVLARDKKDMKTFNKNLKRIVWLREIRMYLEHEPPQEALRNRLDGYIQLRKRIKKEMDDKGMVGAARTAYKKKYEPENIVQHIKTLEYILH